MTDPAPQRIRRRPTRAEPLQPDRPASGSDPDAPADDADPAAAADRASRQTAERQSEQSDSALKNVREGYD